MQYKFEGEIDFYAELAKENSLEETNDDTCNITGEQLGEYHITLLCGHKFNYEPLYNEVKTQKMPHSVFNPNIRIKGSLNVKQIKCPLCRNIQSQILPWIPSLVNCPKIYGVNSPVMYSMYLNKCDYVLKYGKNKGQKCNKQCNDTKCKFHMKFDTLENSVNNTLENPVVTGCPAILKSGINKGKKCGCRIKKNGFCNRHNK